ncbi:pyridoxal phosphate-dependent aminotransferase [Aspergillus affinis]|uniref:pyridoxal phosphate-dependent aminotransferase n=1 Tax=Aspergillus affinis TaxID=1070780 RepID=UPI0022FF3338|nr:PLP-dependent transferase [Aspergillus affinis]KAI9039813.1 PLP-dependent transferase [Aspergillus affinis]
MTRSFGPSKRALKYSGYSALTEVNDIVDDDIYDSETNPNGIVNLGTTMNPLMLDMLTEFTESYRVDPKLANHYNFSTGSPELRTTVADLINRHFSPSKLVDQRNVICSNGLNGLINSLIYTLLDENETVLMPTPAYGMLADVSQKRNEVKCVFADVEDIDQFSASAIDDLLATFSSSIDEAQAQGNPVRVIMMCNPHNPVGRCYDTDVMRAILRFCHQRGLHLVVDEIYALSAFGESFKSALSLDEMPTDNVHVLYGISKDFGFNGLRMGFMISYNEHVLTTLKRAVGRLTRFSYLSENFFISFLSDHAFIDDVYIPTLRQRLIATRTKAIKFLTEYKIPYVPSTAGFYLWIDLSRWTNMFSERDSESPDIQLARHMIKYGVFMQPNKAFISKEKSRFRIGFSRDEVTLREGIERLQRALGEVERKQFKM